MSDPAQPITRVQIHFTPYNHLEIQDLLARVRDEFGNPGHNRRWRFTSVVLGNDEPSSRGWVDDRNGWILDFHFVDPNDAMIFALKYQR